LGAGGNPHKPYIVTDAYRPNIAAKVDGKYWLLCVPCLRQGGCNCRMGETSSITTAAATGKNNCSPIGTLIALVARTCTMPTPQ